MGVCGCDRVGVCYLRLISVKRVVRTNKSRKAKCRRIDGKEDAAKQMRSESSVGPGASSGERDAGRKGNTGTRGEPGGKSNMSTNKQATSISGPGLSRSVPIQK
jgi:hypothetical protein